MALRPLLLSEGELVGLLKDVTALVEGGDSFEGSIEYLMPNPDWPEFCICFTRDKPHEHKHELGGCPVNPVVPNGGWYAVRGTYRIGNSMGQGGASIVGAPFATEQEAWAWPANIEKEEPDGG